MRVAMLQVSPTVGAVQQHIATRLIEINLAKGE